ncbi:anti sigma factor C-terminal domain-containing protein [Paenibacillus hodogayensis]|uniref:Anti sigma factor C-terminal domain-containing protein n=1 Tax=Paenibacillus hodogayensis TaxID=279208 RepID=A0ABV5W3Q6_9BACL
MDERDGQGNRDDRAIEQDVEREISLNLKAWESVDTDDNRQLKLNEKHFKRMIWRTRFAVVRSVVATGLLLFFLYSLYMMGVSLTYHGTNGDKKLARYAITMTNTHMQGLRADVSANTWADITGWFTQRVDLKLYRTVGDWKVKAGEVKGRKTLLNGYTYSVVKDSKYIDGNDSFNFVVPPSLLQGNPSASTAARPSNGVWEQMAHFPDGYVAEMGFSTRRGMKPEELLALLEGYDLRLLSMPVYAGEVREFRPNFSSSAGGDLNWVEHLTLQPPMKFANDHSVSGYSSSLIRENIAEAQSGLLDDIEWLLAEGSYWGDDKDALRLDYLKKNGIEVYGAVVTGPVRELEKLKREEQFYEFKLGQVEIWNWR